MKMMIIIIMKWNEYINDMIMMILNENNNEIVMM